MAVIHFVKQYCVCFSTLSLWNYIFDKLGKFVSEFGKITMKAIRVKDVKNYLKKLGQQQGMKGKISQSPEQQPASRFHE